MRSPGLSGHGVAPGLRPLRLHDMFGLDDLPTEASA
jgi:hypothetical protein